MNAIATIPVRDDSRPVSLAMESAELMGVLRNTLYPGASDASISLVINACIASGKDPMLKPFHIVPMYVKAKDGGRDGMRDVIMPGINSYRVDAARTGQHAGTSEPEFGPLITERLGDRDVTFPEWCKVVVKRRLDTGEIAEFPAIEYWLENYATAGRSTEAPNAMWSRRKRGQIAKCAEAQALRKGFPELGSAPTFEEMEGKVIEGDFSVVEETKTGGSLRPQPKAEPEAQASSNVVEGKFAETDKGGQGKPQQQEQQQRKDPPQQQAGSSDLVSAGMLRTLQSFGQKKNIHADDVREQFGFTDFEKLTSSQANEILNWLRDQDERPARGQSA